MAMPYWGKDGLPKIEAPTNIERPLHEKVVVRNTYTSQFIQSNVRTHPGPMYEIMASTACRLGPLITNYFMPTGAETSIHLRL